MDSPRYQYLGLNVCDGDSANDAFRKILGDLSRGYLSSPRGMRIVEQNNMTVVIMNPYHNVVTYKPRNISKKYLAAELLWYMSARQDKVGTDFIVKHAKFWDKLRSPEGSVNSNYGFYIFSPMSEVFGVENASAYYKTHSQFDYVLDILREDTDSRQAVININNVSHKELQSDGFRTKDFPCTLGLQFLIRDGKLNMSVDMRSTDAVLGYCNDVFQFTMIQEMMLNELNKMDKFANSKLDMGCYILYTGSMHIYERHWHIMLDNGYKNNDYDFDENILNDEMKNKDLCLSDVGIARKFVMTGVFDSENASGALKEIMDMYNGK